MNKLIPILLIVSVLFISGCTQSGQTDTKASPTGQSPSDSAQPADTPTKTGQPQDTSQPDTQQSTTQQTDSGTTQSDNSEGQWEFVQVGTKPVIPKIVYKNELYGFIEDYNRGIGTYKLQGNDWVKVGTEKVMAELVYKDELYGRRSATYKLVGVT